jgi:aryl-alcohol dehydrogenase-like predicted oxidoreductase
MQWMEQPNLTRRGFAALAGASLSLQAQPKPRATGTVTLGRSGVMVTRLAQGTGFNGGARSSAHTRLGEKAFTSLIRHDLDRGVTFMDSADLYGSHPYLRNALRGVAREKYALLSKIWPRTEFWNNHSGGARAEVDRFRKEFATDQIEVVLMHCMMNGKWPQEFARTMDELAELKQKGVVKAVGVSCHDFEALKLACTLPWTDLVLARINNVGKAAAMDAPVEQVAPLLQQARAAGKAVLGMKIFGAGAIKTPEGRDASLKFVFENKLVDAITVGMLSPEEVDDTVLRVDKALSA